MSLLVKAGITRLSELIIDADKDWQAKEIRNLKAIVAGMVQGDIAYRGANTLEKLAADWGAGFNFLHVTNSGQLGLDWRDVQAMIIYLTGAVNRMIALPSLVIPTPSISQVTEQHSSPPGKTATPSLTIPEPTVIAPTMVTVSPQAVGAGIAHDDDVGNTDETTETNNPTANDMHLLPSPGAVGDGFYFGLSDPFDWVCLNIGTPGAGTWTITWKYWNGTTWTALTLKYDETNHFRAAAGKHWVHLVRPGDWATTTILTYTLYFIKAEVTAYTSMTTQPLGTQAWIGKYT